MTKMTKFTSFAFATLLASTASIIALDAANAQAKDTLVMGVQLEPPHLDPTAGAAAAIDEVVYANVFLSLIHI